MSARTFGHLSRAGDKWVLAAVEPQVRIKLKAIFPKVPRAQPPPYEFRASPDICTELAWFCERYPMQISPEDRAALVAGKRSFAAIQAAAEKLRADTYQPPLWVGLKPGCAPRPHQASACELLAMFGGLLDGSDVGQGKTFTAMCAALLPNALPAVIVCDRDLQAQWAQRFAEFTNLTTYCVNTTTPHVLPPVDVLIFAWSQMLGWADVWETLSVGLAAGDEMQEVRTGEASQKGQSAAELFRVARYKLGLTATPIYNWGTEIYTVMRYLRPEVLGEHGDFMREWAPHGRISDPRALGAYLRERNALVRKRKPGNRINRLEQHVPYDPEPLEAIEGLAQQLALTATTGSFVERGDAMRNLDMLVREATGIAKAPSVAEVIRAIVEGGEPVLVAAWHRRVYDILNEALADLRPAMFTGSESKTKKAREKARFISGDTDVMFISIRSARGHDDLQQRCKFAIVAELDWSPPIYDQFFGRLDREGSLIDDTDEKITALFLVTDEGSDPPMIERNGLKASQASQIVDPDLGVQQVQNDGSHLRSLLDRYLAGAGPVRQAHSPERDQQPESTTRQGASLHPRTDAALSERVDG